MLAGYTAVQLVLPIRRVRCAYANGPCHWPKRRQRLNYRTRELPQYLQESLLVYSRVGHRRGARAPLPVFGTSASDKHRFTAQPAVFNYTSSKGKVA